MCRFRSMQKCKRAEWHGSPINFWCSPVLSLHPLMQNERMWHGNAYGKGRVLGVQPRRCICTNASRGLSATAEFFVFICETTLTNFSSIIDRHATCTIFGPMLSPELATPLFKTWRRPCLYGVSRDSAMPSTQGGGPQCTQLLGTLRGLM